MKNIPIIIIIVLLTSCSSTPKNEQPKSTIATSNIGYMLLVFASMPFTPEQLMKKCGWESDEYPEQYELSMLVKKDGRVTRKSVFPPTEFAQCHLDNFPKHLPNPPTDNFNLKFPMFNVPKKTVQLPASTSEAN